MIFKDTNELEAYVNASLKIVINNVSEKVLGALQAQIENTIYSQPEPKIYTRSGDFKNAFKLKPLKKVVRGITREIFYDWQSMSEPTADDLYKHGYYNHGNIVDRRKILADVLNSPFFNLIESEFGGAYNQEAYWDNFINYLNRNIWIWFNEEMKKAGLLGR